MIEQTDNRQNGDIHNGSAKQLSTKISNEFADRLASLPSGHQVRAVVLPAPYLVNGNNGGSNGSRVRGEERQAILREARTRTEETFAEFDNVLAGIGGQRLTR